MAGLDWLTARPIAHRGLHDAAAGTIENTASAVAAAIGRSYAIEVDLQVTADGEAVVYHDDALGRLTDGQGRLAAMNAEELARVPFKATGDRIMRLSDLCARVHGRVPLILELKSHYDGDCRLPRRVAEVLITYGGPVAAMSFDPDVLRALREIAPGLPRGIVAERRYTHGEWAKLPAQQKFSWAHLLHGFDTRPHFVAYAVRDLPAAAPLIARYVFGLPLLTWTVRTDHDLRVAQRWADQMIFEGLRP
jgi:glycerophosphoryl diester phosphodiesterase